MRAVGVKAVRVSSFKAQVQLRRNPLLGRFGFWGFCDLSIWGSGADHLRVSSLLQYQTYIGPLASFGRL